MWVKSPQSKGMLLVGSESLVIRHFRNYFLIVTKLDESLPTDSPPFNGFRGLCESLWQSIRSILSSHSLWQSILRSDILPFCLIRASHPLLCLSVYMVRVRLPYSI